MKLREDYIHNGRRRWRDRRRYKDRRKSRVRRRRCIAELTLLKLEDEILKSIHHKATLRKRADPRHPLTSTLREPINLGLPYRSLDERRRLIHYADRIRLRKTTEVKSRKLVIVLNLARPDWTYNRGDYRGTNITGKKSRLPRYGLRHDRRRRCIEH